MNRYSGEVRKAWQFIRELTTDDAYENYLARHRDTHPDVPPLSRREFFTSEQCRKWSGIQRCC
jgi:uncharacterized short protein YbdD (DUF466 family)